MAKLYKAASVMICVCILAALLVGCSGDPADPTADGTSKTTYSLVLKNASGLPLADVRVFIYEDADQSELVCVGKTDAEGAISFIDETSDSYVAVLDELPVGYSAEQSYELTGESTVITLTQRELTEEDMDQLSYSLGDAMLDFSITDCEGVEYTLSQLLTEKRAVVLNFWYLNCAPCKMEFPYLQEAYEQYSDQITLLAMNPVDGDDASISAFKSENGLTISMSRCDIRWQSMMNVSAYPTTVIIDRYGNICLIHRGMFTDSTALKNALEYFTGDDYKQEFFDSIEEIPS